MTKTKIEWTDESWNPITGCTEVSPGCDHCYAKTFAERWRGTPGHAYEQGFDVTLRPERLDQPLRWTKPRRVFVNSMSDLFHADIPDDYIARVFAVMTLAQQHTFQVLTKRHGRMRSLLSSATFADQVDYAIRQMYLVDGWVSVQAAATAPSLAEAPLPNVWLGVSVEDQQRADLRVHALLNTPAAVRFLSCEPLLGPVTLGSWLWDGVICGSCPPDSLGHPRIDWVIVGGESGRGSRPMHPAWPRYLRDACVNAGVPFLFKQWGEWVEETQAPADATMPAEGWHPFGTDGPCLYRMRSKHLAGRELDGRTWDEYPNR